MVNSSPSVKAEEFSPGEILFELIWAVFMNLQYDLLSLHFKPSCKNNKVTLILFSHKKRPAHANLLISWKRLVNLGNSELLILNCFCYLVTLMVSPCSASGATTVIRPLAVREISYPAPFVVSPTGSVGIATR